MTFFTGAGISQASGLPLFTVPDGKRNTSIKQRFSAQDIHRARPLLLNHYNQRTREMANASPSDAHYLITSLMEYYRVQVVTQNIDDLHERSGLHEVLHLHGQLTWHRTDDNCCHKINTTADIISNARCPHGSRWRHDIVLYDEPVQRYHDARRIFATTDILIVVGCSLQTSTAQHLVEQVHERCPIYFINPFPQFVPQRAQLIKQPAYQGIWTALNDFLM